MRDRARERLGEMRKRTEEEEEGEARKVKQRRRCGVEALDWLKEKKKILKKVKEQEMKDKREESVNFILLAVFFLASLSCASSAFLRTT